MTLRSISEDDPRILVRADAGRSIGSGHVVRSLTIAGYLAERGVRAVFATRDDSGSTADRVRAEGYELIVVPGNAPPGSMFDGPWSTDEQIRDLDFVLAHARGSYEAVIVDHYGLDARWERGIRSISPRVVALDDLANRSHDADVLVDQNWYGPETTSRYDELVSDRCVQLLGPRYAPLQTAYVGARAARSPLRNPAQRVLVSFGGADPTGETLKVVQALSAPEFGDVAVDVVLGSRHLLTGQLEGAIVGRPATTLHVGLPTLAGLLAESDLAVGASGSATWERACLGVPALVTTTSAAHSGVTAALSEAGMTVWAGLGGEVSVDHYRDFLMGCMAGDLEPPPPLADGLGAARVADAIVPTDPSALQLRLATERDAALFLGDDRGGRPGGPKQLDGPRVWQDEAARFAEDLIRPECVVLVMLLGATPIGRVHAVADSGVVEAAYVLDDFVTGRALGPLVAAALVESRWAIKGSELAYRGPPDAGPPVPSPQEGSDDLFGSVRIPASSIAGTP